MGPARDPTSPRRGRKPAEGTRPQPHPVVADPLRGAMDIRAAVGNASLQRAALLQRLKTNVTLDNRDVPGPELLTIFNNVVAPRMQAHAAPAPAPAAAGAGAPAAPITPAGAWLAKWHDADRQVAALKAVGRPVKDLRDDLARDQQKIRSQISKAAPGPINVGALFADVQRLTAVLAPWIPVGDPNWVTPERIQHNSLKNLWELNVPGIPDWGAGLKLLVAAYNWWNNEFRVLVTVAGRDVVLDRTRWVVKVGALEGGELKYHRLAARLTAESAQGGAPAQVARLRQIVDGGAPAAATDAEVAIAATWFGIEVLRSGRSFPVGKMMLELMGTGYGTKGKTFEWTNVLQQPEVPNETPAAWKVRKDASLTPSNILADLPATRAHWGGKHPMAHEDSEAEAAAPIPAAGPLNVEHAREAALLRRWIAARNITTEAQFRAEVEALLV